MSELHSSHKVVYLQKFKSVILNEKYRVLKAQICSRHRIMHILHLPLLTMTNPNQLCDVLLFVYSKMADETNLSSTLPVADRTREV